MIATFAVHAAFVRERWHEEAARKLAQEQRGLERLAAELEFAREQARRDFVAGKLAIQRELGELLDRLANEPGNELTPFLWWTNERAGRSASQLTPATIALEIAENEAFKQLP